MKDKTKAPEPMDASTREVAVGTPATNHPRVCGAIKQLVAEFHALFPETPVEYSNYNGRNTALDVMFDLTSLAEDTDRVDAFNLLALLGESADPRIDYVIAAEEDGVALVSMRSSLRTQDDPSSFGLADVFSVLVEPDAGYDDDGDDFGGSL